MSDISTTPPQSVDVLIIGGGPAGSYAASVLAREGIFNVALLEASKFPRYHIGESMIPSIRKFLRFVDVEETIMNYGFIRKPGAAHKFTQHKREAYTDFLSVGEANASWNVLRSEFDKLLLDHARSCGASVYEETKVTSLQFSEEDASRPISAAWTRTGASPDVPEHSTTIFKYLIDASGRNGIMSTKYLKNRSFNSSLKNIAVWGYWKDVGSYGTGTTRSGAPFFEAMTDESGWVWFIPIHNGTTSVGVVMNQQIYNEKAAASDASPSPFSSAHNPSKSSMVDRYLAGIALAPGITQLISQNGKLQDGSVKSASDYSYSAPSYAGPGFRIAGDAGAFIDPFFSSGVHLAFTSALSAAATICASVRGDCSEQDAADWHTKRFATSYTRFQIIVLSAYKQMRAQSKDFLSDIDEDNYDRAFEFLRPVMHGASDMGIRLSDHELQDSLDFCSHIFNPSLPEDFIRLRDGGSVPKELMDLTAPIVDPVVIEDALHVHKDANGTDTSPATEASDTETIKMVLKKVNARRVLHSELKTSNFESEPLGNGRYVVRLEKGNLGLGSVANRK